VTPEQILAQRSPFLVRFFAGRFQRQMQKTFSAVRIMGQPPPIEGKLVVYSNHPSWWDAAVYLVLSQIYFADVSSYGPIEASQLKRYPFLSRLGIFGIEIEGFSGAARFIRVAKAAFAHPRTMLWITPEGQFTDPRPRPLQLRGGLTHLGRLPGITYLPLAIEYVFWNESKPELLLHFGAPVSEGLTEALVKTMDELAAASIARDPARFTILLGGRAGVGGIYDAWRRLCSLWRHEPFNARHGAS
jgi:1-acyl-sn-glycerol-3-phosphate acyltransferase